MHNPSPQPGQLVNEKEAAEILNIKRQTLSNWRAEGVGPRYRKVGRLVRYHLADLQAFIEGCEDEWDKPKPRKPNSNGGSR